MICSEHVLRVEIDVESIRPFSQHCPLVIVTGEIGLIPGYQVVSGAQVGK